MSLDEFRALLDKHARPDWHTPVDGLLISRVDHPEPPSASMSGTVLAVIARGEKRLALGDRVYSYGPGQYLVASVDMPVTGAFLGPALGLGLTLDPSVIADLLLRAGPFPRPGGVAPSGIAVSDVSPDLLDALIRLLRLLDQPRDRPVLAPMIIREILWRLITGEQGDVVRQLGLADSSLAHVARAVRWIREHYTRPFQVAEVARLAGMSESAFYRNFQAVTAMSPIQFQKQIRLQHARLLLAASPSDVAAVGHQVGYDSPSQFSREYRRQFGAPPREDALRLRDVTAGAALP
jgi:AraC-like DNA-binding protein